MLFEKTKLSEVSKNYEAIILEKENKIRNFNDFKNNTQTEIKLAEKKLNELESHKKTIIDEINQFKKDISSCRQKNIRNLDANREELIKELESISKLSYQQKMKN